MNTLANPQERADCAVRALAVACNRSYQDAHEALRAAGRKPGCATYHCELKSAARKLGFSLIKMNASGTIANVKRELPSGRWIVWTARHFIGVVDGEAIDWAAGSRKRIKFAYKAKPVGA